MRTASALLAALFLTGCAGPSYYWQAASGHFELMRARQDIGEYLAGASLSDPLAQRLEVAQDALLFAASELGLPAGDSYRSLAVTGRDAVVWNVVATPEFSLQPRTWCFPVAGCVPYRGYFTQAEANRAADGLRRKGMDVAVSGALAYSSLGWFDDPIIDSMLALPDARLAGALFHELAHQRVYVKGDTSFNESYATFVEREGVRAWLLNSNAREELVQWEERLQASDQFQSLLLRTRGELEAAYASGLGPEAMRNEKSSAFDTLRLRYEQLKEQRWNGRDWFPGWVEKPPNNADLALANSYQGGVCAFRELYELAGGNFSRFHSLAIQQAALKASARTAWLSRPCQ